MSGTIRENLLLGDPSASDSQLDEAGQFVNIQLSGKFLRRPISVCDYDAETLTIVYKVVGSGTEQMSEMEKGTELDILTGLGNGYDLSLSGDKPVLLGGGVGVPPMYNLAKKLMAQGKDVTVILGFNTKDPGANENDGLRIRQLATEYNVTMFTSLDTVKALLDVLEETTLTISTIDA